MLGYAPGYIAAFVGVANILVAIASTVEHNAQQAYITTRNAKYQTTASVCNEIKNTFIARCGQFGANAQVTLSAINANRPAGITDTTSIDEAGFDNDMLTGFAAMREQIYSVVNFAFDGGGNPPQDPVGFKIAQDALAKLDANWAMYV